VKRKFVSITPIRVVDDRGAPYVGAMAVADDGTAWNFLFTKGKGWYWSRLPDLPDLGPT
jgi:hypothetical protein